MCLSVSGIGCFVSNVICVKKMMVFDPIAKLSSMKTSYQIHVKKTLGLHFICNLCLPYRERLLKAFRRFLKVSIFMSSTELNI